MIVTSHHHGLICLPVFVIHPEHQIDDCYFTSSCLLACLLNANILSQCPIIVSYLGSRTPIHLTFTVFFYTVPCCLSQLSKVQRRQLLCTNFTALASSACSSWWTTWRHLGCPPTSLVVSGGTTMIASLALCLLRLSSNASRHVYELVKALQCPLPNTNACTCSMICGMAPTTLLPSRTSTCTTCPCSMLMLFPLAVLPTTPRKIVSSSF